MLGKHLFAIHLFIVMFDVLSVIFNKLKYCKKKTIKNQNFMMAKKIAIINNILMGHFNACLIGKN